MITAGADYENQFSLANGFDVSRESAANPIGGKSSPHRQAVALAPRLEAIGINPYQSDKERYLVALQDGPARSSTSGGRFGAPGSSRAMQFERTVLSSKTLRPLPATTT